MKAVVLALSFALNVALAWVLSGRPDRATPETTLALVPSRPPAAQPPLERLRSPEALRDHLLDLGFPREVVWAVVRATLEEPRLARLREFNAAAGAKRWWQRGAAGKDLTGEQQRELRQLVKAERQEITRVLGVEASVTEAELERFEFLGHDKAVRVAALDRDYDELRNEMMEAGPSAGQRTLLDAAYQRDVAGILSPEEQAQLAERESRSARNLSYRFAYFAATETEYRALFALQKKFDEDFPAGPRSGDGGKSFGTAMQNMHAEMKTTLGPERYDAYLLAQRPEFRALKDLHSRFGVSPFAFDQVSRLQSEMMTEGARIAADTALDRTQKKTALLDLANRARLGVTSALGADLGGRFLTATAPSWIDLLATGKVYGAQPSGGTSVSDVAVDRPAPK